MYGVLWRNTRGKEMNKLEKATVRLIINPFLEKHRIDPKEAKVEIHFK